jgi:AcrR family transcriptional regulator
VKVVAIRKRLPPAERRAEILAVAATMFRERGYAATSVDMIGAAIGISGPAIYRHFEHKQALLIALLDVAVQGATAQIDATVSAASPDTRLSVMAAAILHHAVSERAGIGLLQTRAIDLDESGRAQLAAIRAGLTDHLCYLLGETADRQGAARRLRAAFAVVGELAAGPSLPADDERAYVRIVEAILAS